MNKLWSKIICLACVNCLVSTYFIFLISARKGRIQNAIKLNADRNLPVPSEAAQKPVFGKESRSFPAGLDLYPSNKLFYHLQCLLPNALTEGIETFRTSGISVP